MPHRFVATHTPFAIIRALRSPMKTGWILLAFLTLWASAPGLMAQADDPSDAFLKAYMTAQQGEKLEHENQFQSALAKYRFAGTLLEQLHKAHPEWQPAIVEYRGRKVSESILRVQDKAGTQGNLAAASEPVGKSPAGVIPQNPAAQVAIPKEKTVATSPVTAPKPAPASTPNEVAIEQATKKLRDRVDQLESELQKSRSAMSAAENEKQSLNSRLGETKSKLDQAQGDLDKAKTAEKQVRDQLAQAQESLKKTAEAGSKDNKAQEVLKSEISELKKALSTAQQGRSTAEKERDDANAKVASADQQRAASARERDEANARAADSEKKRDDALAQLKGLKDTQQKVEVLVAENSDLKQKLATAEKTVREIGEDKPKKEKELADVRKQITDLQAQLAASQKENKDYQITVAQLRAQLDDASKQLEQVKLVGSTPEETAKLTKENEMLRNIIVRERQEEARRDKAKKMMLAELH